MPPKQPNSVFFVPDQLHADLLGTDAPHRHLRPQPPPRAASLGKASHVRVHRKAAPPRRGAADGERRFLYGLKAALQHERPGLVGRAIAVRGKERCTCGACTYRPSPTTTPRTRTSG
ncbi:hypothetical protein, partial [Streptomyces sp. NPDC056982]|uniref:hypothetical protein n=1 Tax=Streptomyces sp. NPDC056982 TaxID=3345986 RepID=UPI00362C829D